MKTGIVIQARMGSTRLPGKVLMPLPKDGSYRTIDWVIASCQETGFPVYVATSTNVEDDVIAEHVHGKWVTHGIELFRGHPTDVLDRIYQCAVKHGLDVIVRVTGDCPFIDSEVIRQVVALLEHAQADYASNVDPPTWPDGLDVQAVTMGALHEAWKHATDPTDRDTVLQWIVRHRKDFEVVNLPCPFPGMERQRWVLDTEEDYEICSNLAANLLLRPKLVDLLAAAHYVNETPFPNTHAQEGARNERYLAARAPELGTDGLYDGSEGTGLIARSVQPYGASTYSKSHVAWGKDAPLYVTHAQGSRVFDVDGNEFIDFTGGLGTTILGHSDARVRDAIQGQLNLGIAFPLAHDLEREVALRVIRRVGWNAGYSQVVFGKNGSDVTSAAVRLARVVTGRKHVVVIGNGYHGWHDWTLAGSARGGGTPEEWRPTRFKDVEETIGALGRFPFAAVIVEPDMASPDDNKALIAACRLYGAACIFDEMVTAFRYPKLTYAATYGLEPDLICLGKALGNGMPITALVGKKEHMQRFVTDPSAIGVGGAGAAGEPYAFYSGTHFGETLSLAAAGCVLQEMDSYWLERLHGRACRIHDIVVKAISDQDMNGYITVGLPPLSRLTFPTPAVAHQFRREMAKHGILVYSAFFAMVAHSDADLEQLKHALDFALAALRNPPAEAPMPATGIMRS